MTERMENALNHIKTSVDVDPWAVEEVERVFRMIDNKWISASDETPDKQDEYLIAWTGRLGTCDDWGRSFLEIAEYEPETDEWDLEHIYGRGWTNVEVLAWMPLPDPYLLWGLNK